MEKLRFGLIGCGRIITKHIEALDEIENVEIAAVCDINKKKCYELGTKLNVPYYTDYNEMLYKEKIDVVSILTPSGMHAEHVIEIVKKHKKHIVCEKPMALNLNDADRMINICKEHHVKLFIVKQNRFNLPVQKLKEEIEKGKFGKLVLGTVRVRWARHQEYYDSDNWRGTKNLDGGALTNQASHHIDLLIWMMGKPKEIFALTATRLVNIESEDTGIALISFENGALGIIEATTAARPTNIEGSLSILGEYGTIEIGGTAVNEVKVWKFENEKEIIDEIKEKYSESPPNVYGYGHKRFLESVVSSIQNDLDPQIDGLEGRKSLEVLEAIYKSVAERKMVRFESDK